MGDEISKIAIFRQKEIRKQLYTGEWWFVINDIVAAITESTDPAQYLKKLRQRDIELAKFFEEDYGKGVVQIVPPLRLVFDTKGGKQKMLSWNTEGILRLIQSIPSPKAEPFKRWLAKVGYERVQEIENPELAQKRIRATYLAKGYEKDWIERRIHGMETRSGFTEEWKKRGVEGDQNYAILTAEISKATFGITPSEHKKLKGLKRHNLRDHMSRLELLFTDLGEESTKEIAKVDNVHGMIGNKDAARRGGKIAGSARQQLEIETGKKVINKQNFLNNSENNKLQ